MDLEFLQRLAKAITSEFGESSEVVVHDISGDDTEHTIVAIENGHVSHRQAGGSASRVVLEAIQRKHDPNLVDELGYLTKTRPHDDQRRIGLCLADKGLAAIAALPGPAEGVLPEALSAIPDVALRTLHINLSELIRHLPGNNVAFAHMPLAEMVDTPGQNLL